MKKFNLLRWSLPAVLLMSAGSMLFAQSENGTVIKKRFKDLPGNHSESHAYTLINENPGFHYQEQRDPCRVFIGVGTSSVDGGGLKVDYTVDNTPATRYGVQKGDVILTLDGVKVNTQTDLVTQRDKHQQGEAFSLTILRDGREMKIDARFNACTQEEIEQSKKSEKMRLEHLALLNEELQEMRIRMDEVNYSPNVYKTAERPIIGIYPGEEWSAEGVKVGSVIAGKGAEAAGIREGDLITKVDGKSVAGEGSISSVLAGRKPGDKVMVAYLRDGKAAQTEVTLSASQSYVYQTVERDPCKVFIGVYTSDAAEGKSGVRVSGVIENTPAKESSVVPGDVILELDGVPVNTHLELRTQRDKHQPGDRFEMTILRNGETMTIDARFKSCDKNNSENPAKDVVEVLNEEPQDAEQRNLDNSVKMKVFSLSPNPTVGLLNVQFEAEAVPTTVTISDLTGKTVYSKTINQFSGFYAEQIDLDGQTPGNYVLSITQGNKVSTKKFILMPRA